MSLRFDTIVKYNVSGNTGGIKTQTHIIQTPQTLNSDHSDMMAILKTLWVRLGYESAF